MSDCHPRHHETAAPVMALNYNTDGALDRVFRLGQRQKAIPAIFIHAGAGFHSHQNEHVHLEACVSAAEMGMRFLKAGATATEAVEAALRILEDKEITNAGYGSNLSIDGTVECDATIVDHLGRSGACGAVPNIRNPISLAKLILDTSNMPLTLRRVPPNALVGGGARVFAEEHGMVTFANEYLVSRNSRDRFFRWQADLMHAEGATKGIRLGPPTVSTPLGYVPCQYDTAATPEPQKQFPREHTAAIMTGTWNEGQTDSPCAGTPLLESAAMTEASLFPAAPRAHGGHSSAAAARPSLRMPRPPLTLTALPDGKSNGLSSAGHKKPDQPTDTTSTRKDGMNEEQPLPITRPAEEVGKTHPTDGTVPRGTGSDSIGPRGLKRPLNATSAGGGDPNGRAAKRANPSGVNRDDCVTDTIGAIAIDEKGQIAAGSSSGGIGMKHRGRLGPAALVGVGTAIVPCADEDVEGRTVAAVTSGTGEHMATTMASQRCAERIYHGTRQGSGGCNVDDDDEDAVMESFIANDFMNHPGVRGCHSAGAIGVMVVKKCRTGYYLYFAHNTDSFALASMGGLDKEPRCTMSRLSEGAKIAKGGRRIRLG